MNGETKVTWEYHQRTKHSLQSVRSSRHYLDWQNQPAPFKLYADIESLPLPGHLGDSGAPALAAVSRVEVPPDVERIPGLKDLARILYFSAGITKQRQYPAGEIFFRASSCTGALYEIDLYVVCADLPDLAAGVYHFNPKNFSLGRLRHGDYRSALAHAAGQEPAIAQAPAVMACTGTYWRNAWKYQARTYRHFGWDNGTLLANLLAMCSALDLPARLVLGFVDDEVNTLLALETDREVALSLVPIGRQSETLPASNPRVERLTLQTLPSSEREVEYPEMRQMHAATRIESADEVRQWRNKELSIPSAASALPLEPPALEARSADSIEKVILRRGSSRQFRRESISLAEFSTVLYAASRGISTDFLSASEAFLNGWYLIIHAVEEIPPGSYRFHPGTFELEPLREGDFREQSGYLGLGQALAADASFNVFFMANLDLILKTFGNRGYRAAQLEAGILGGKLYLAAYAQRLGATGLTFFDDDVVEFFSPHARDKETIFLMALGRGQKPNLPTIE